ncbi:hypothetical protein IDH44_18575 [Paenibacillus sp. IB182496]|uniref:Phosphotyrosine protein phosphatase I domain-containing protein n=1 Tax=Paenibacillus sabuli TaxID=2772509 RepID=A0A927BX34_9BACL|nr:hypothetical protein [Paenibacillus sabuli]MBD2847210.1 hypothetical protein [Paenibacillus sabuli]
MVEISGHSSDVIAQATLQEADYIITLCGRADEHCPAAPGARATRRHWGFDDPAQAAGTEEEVMAAFRQVRDAIQARIGQFLSSGQ